MAAKAVSAVGESEFEAVLMDIQMPVLDGYEATRRIRSDPRFKDLPIIAMTASVLAGDQERALAAGMNEHVSKPVDPQQLFSTLMKYIESGKRQAPIEISPQKRFSKNTDEDSSPDLPGIDTESGLSRVGGNLNMFRKLLAKFSARHTGGEEEIKSALKDGDIELAKRLAHTLKGVSGTIGAMDLYAAAGDLEAALKDGKTEDFESLLDKFALALNQVLGSIDSLDRSKEPSPPSGEELEDDGNVMDIAGVKPLMMELAALLRVNDMEALDCLEAHKKHLGNTGLTNELTKLEEKIEQYDFESALEGLNKMAKSLTINLEGESFGQ